MHSTAKSVTTGAHRGAGPNNGKTQVRYRRKRAVSDDRGEEGKWEDEIKGEGEATTNTKIHAIHESGKRQGNSRRWKSHLQRMQDPETTQRTADSYATIQSIHTHAQHDQK